MGVIKSSSRSELVTTLLTRGAADRAQVSTIADLMVLATNRVKSIATIKIAAIEVSEKIKTVRFPRRSAEDRLCSSLSFSAFWLTDFLRI